MRRTVSMVIMASFSDLKRSSNRELGRLFVPLQFKKKIIRGENILWLNY
jgi:hypothetical protein